ncbi:MAG: CBS domain-containing protein [Acidimicrobiales bacterium]
MLADQILERKGREVATVLPEATVRAAAQALADVNVGALVVSPDGSTLVGIVSERDIVRRLAVDGPDLLDQPVSSLMKAEVHTCSGADTIDQMMHLMSEHRIRHLPVLADGVLAGIISIGDVVKTRVDELETEKDQLVDYIRGR